MKDIQSQPDNRRIDIKKVGVKEIFYPVTVLDKENKIQKTVAKVNMYVNLPHHFKGTHMSRFIEILNRFHGKITIESFHTILEETKQKLQAEEAHFEIEFPYFMKRKVKRLNAPDTDKYICAMHGSLAETDDLVLNVKVPIHPPPLPISIDYAMPRSLGQWGIADISVRFKQFIWLEDLIQLVEQVTTKHLDSTGNTENFSDNVLSVEGLTKEISDKLAKHAEIKWFIVRVENLSEGFSTFATLEWPENIKLN